MFEACGWPTAVVGVTAYAVYDDGCVRFDFATTGMPNHPALALPPDWVTQQIRWLTPPDCDAWGIPPDQGVDATEANGQVIALGFGDGVVFDDVIVSFPSDEREIGDANAVIDAVCVF